MRWPKRADRSDRGDLGTFVRNLRQPGALGWKASRYVQNMLIRARRRSGCCGNNGEPGC